MQAMVLEQPGSPLVAAQLPVPDLSPGQVLLRVSACGVCRTDLHVVDGELRQTSYPLVPGHEIVGYLEGAAADVEALETGDRLGIAWLASSCMLCRYCRSGLENLCDKPQFTGYTRNGGYAEYVVAEAAYCFRLPDKYNDVQAAPLMCAGLIGWRSYKLARDGEKIGLWGFGAAAHLITQVACHESRQIYAFTRPGDRERMKFARELGAVWAGGADENPPDELDAAIIFAPVGSLVPPALRSVRKGGVVVLAGIYMSDIPGFPYEILWGERQIRSVANLTRQDACEFMSVAASAPIRISCRTYALADANQALEDLRAGRLSGAAVLVP